jgi:hypothetical protein
LPCHGARHTVVTGRVHVRVPGLGHGREPVATDMLGSNCLIAPHVAASVAPGRRPGDNRSRALATLYGTVPTTITALGQACTAVFSRSGLWLLRTHTSDTTAGPAGSSVTSSATATSAAEARAAAGPADLLGCPDRDPSSD